MTELLLKIFVKNYQNVKDAKVREGYGTLGSIVGILANVFLCTFKFFAGTLTASIAIVADAFNNLTDALSSVISLIGFKIASRPADKNHPFGHGRMEYLAGLLISLIIILVGFELLKSSAMKIIHPEEVYFKTIAIVIMVVSIFVKLALYLFNKNLGKRINSQTLEATAIDSLNDTISTGAVIISMLFFHFTEINIDGFVGVAVAIFILYAGFNTAKETLDPILGDKPDPELVEKITERVKSFSYVHNVHDLIIHNYGPNNILVSLHAEVPYNIDILLLHDQIDLIERTIRDEFHCETVIHMDPVVLDDPECNRVYTTTKKVVSAISKELSIHDFRMVKGPTHTNLIFDIVIPYGFPLKDEVVLEQIEQQLKLINEKFEVVISVDHAYSL